MCSRPRRFRPSRLIAFLSALLAIALAIAAAKPLRVAWYKYKAITSRDRALRTPRSERQHRLLSDYLYYRDALVQIGYLTNRVFPLRHISVPSEESREFWKLVHKHFPENIYVRLQGYETNRPDQLVVWDTPDNMAPWERFIAEYDSPDFRNKVATNSFSP